MQPVTASALARLLCEADADTRGEFLAGLYEERGNEAWVVDGAVYVRADEARRGEEPRVASQGEQSGTTDPGARRVLVRTRVPEAVPAGADAVVVTDVVDDPPPGVEDARTVRNRLLYGVDRERARALFESTFDRPLVEAATESGIDGPGADVGTPGGSRDGEGDVDAGPDTDGLEGADGAGPSSPDSGSGALGRLAGAVRRVRERTSDVDPDGPDGSGTAWTAGVAVVLVVALAVAAALVLGLPGGGVAGAGSAAASDAGDAGLAADAPDSRGDSPGSAVTTDDADAARTTTAADGTATATATPNATDETLPPGGTTLPADHPRTLPPGVEPDGVTDEIVLARAHARALENRSYRLTLVHRETVDGVPSGVARETVRVESASRYVSTVEQAGDMRRDPLVVGDGDAYVNGTVRVDRTTGVNGAGFGARFSNGVGGDPADRGATYVRWFLSVEESRVVDTFERDGLRFFWLVVDGDPYPGVENTTGTALVDGTGLVHEVRRSYDYPGADGVAATVVVRYDDLDVTTVEPPAWYEGDDERSAEAPPWYVAPTDEEEYADANASEPGNES